jgi:hypothetical protein
MPPRYRRVVPWFAPRAYCKPHSHLADAEMAQFIAEERQRFTAAFAGAAVRAAAFETEELPARVLAGMTNKQKRTGVAVVAAVNGSGKSQAAQRSEEN